MSPHFSFLTVCKKFHLQIETLMGHYVGKKPQNRVYANHSISMMFAGNEHLTMFQDWFKPWEAYKTKIILAVFCCALLVGGKKRNS